MKKIILKFSLEKSKNTLFATFIITLIIGSGIRFILMDDNIEKLPTRTNIINGMKWLVDKNKKLGNIITNIDDLINEVNYMVAPAVE